LIINVLLLYLDEIKPRKAAKKPKIGVIFI